MMKSIMMKNIEIMISDKEDNIIKKKLIHLEIVIKINLELMGGSEFVFDYVQLLYYKCHKIGLNHDGLYVNSLDWIKNKKSKSKYQH